MNLILILLGCLSFVIMTITDLYLYRKKYYAFLFYLAISMLAFSMISHLSLFNSSIFNTYHFNIRIIFILFAIIFFTLEIYTVFFAVKTGAKSVRDTGVYGLCRHPGMLWFAGLCFSLTFAFNLPFFVSCIYSLLNLVYICIQDIIVFPRDIEGYNDYKNRTPFFPTYKSFIECTQFYLSKGKKYNAS